MKNHILTQVVTRVSSSYVKHNHIPASELPTLIDLLSRSFTFGLAEGVNAKIKSNDDVNAYARYAKKATTPDRVVCLKCGKHFKFMKRHLREVHDLTPERYRITFNLSPDYPLVASNYSKRRSEMAVAVGLGRMRKLSKNKDSSS